MIRWVLLGLLAATALVVSDADAGIWCKLAKHREVVVGWLEDSSRPRRTRNGDPDPVALWAVEVTYDDQGSTSNNTAHARRLAIAECQRTATTNRVCRTHFSWDIDAPNDPTCAVIYYVAWEVTGSGGEKYRAVEVDSSTWYRTSVSNGFDWARKRRDEGGAKGLYRNAHRLDFGMTSNCVPPGTPTS